MRRTLAPIVIAATVIVVLLYNTFFIVPQTAQALVLEFGRPVRVINVIQDRGSAPGLYAKVPFVQNVVMFDRRNLGLNLDSKTIIASDQEQLNVDAYARWRVIDPLRFYQKVQDNDTAQLRLETIMVGSLRRVLGSVPSNDIVFRQRSALMRLIRDQMNTEASDWGIQIIDVRLRQVDLPPQTAERVYERMRTERQQVAAQLRAEGDETAAKIRAEADRTVTVTLATAREQSEKTRGDGDAKRAAIFAQSFGRDPEFAAFYRSLQAYEKAMPKGTTMIVPPDGEFFKYMKKQSVQ